MADCCKLNHFCSVSQRSFWQRQTFAPVVVHVRFFRKQTVAQLTSAFWASWAKGVEGRTMADAMQQLLARGLKPEGTAEQALLMPPEAERMIEGLAGTAGAEDVGKPAWLKQHAWIEKLNLQSHANASAHAADFVCEYLVSHAKVNDLVRELLVMEVWKEHLMPLLSEHLAHKVDSLTSYALIFHEANVANLLEMVLYDEAAFEVMDDDHMVELVDWCIRKMTYLTTEGHSDAKPLKLSPKEHVDRAEIDLFNDRVKEIRLGVAMCSVTVLRYMTGAVSTLPISVVTRIGRHHDPISVLVPLLEAPPWLRENGKQQERREGTQWVAVPPSDRFKLSNIDAQVWLTLNNLVVDPHFRSKYKLDGFRKDTVCRIRRFLNDLLIDQLPVLKDLQRVVDEISLNYSPNFNEFESGTLVIEQVPQIRADMMNKNWQQIASDAISGTLHPQRLAADSKQRIEGMLAALDFLADHQDLTAPHAGNDADKAEQPHPAIKISVYTKMVNGTMAAAHSLELTVDESKPPVPITLKGDAGVEVQGERWSLTLCDGEFKPFPHQGRIAVCYGSSSAQALLELPFAATKQDSDMKALADGLWVTVGLLAQDKFALQLKLKKDRVAAQRDTAAGVWNVYVPKGGAITVLKEVKKPPGKENATPARMVTEVH